MTAPSKHVGAVGVNFDGVGDGLSARRPTLGHCTRARTYMVLALLSTFMPAASALTLGGYTFTTSVGDTKLT